MSAPDNPIPLRYLSLGACVIPLAPKDKRPYLAILDGDPPTWKPYQNRRPTQDEIQRWLARGADHNWGIVCGVVSGGMYCGDVDDPNFAHWALLHAKDPLFKGACIVESGSGKAHIWFKSSSPVFSGGWRPRGGKKLGDIRGEGSGGAGPSYMVVPPSVHPDTGQQYRFRAGTIANLPTVDDGDQFLADILQSYLKEHPADAPDAPKSNNKQILQLEPADEQRVWEHVRALKLKARIKDTLLVAGNQDPNSRHWQRGAGTHSEIDFAVCCELLRKGQSFEQIEQIYACCHVGAACYRNKGRPNHGYAYLKTTYDEARAEIEREKQAARVASGTNFKVTEALRLQFDTDMSHYLLTLDCTLTDGSVRTVKVTISDDDLFSLERFAKALGKQAQFVPQFANNQQGRHFGATFGQAVMSSVEDVRVAPEAHTRYGILAAMLRERLGAFRDVEPENARQTSGMGWREGDDYFLRGMRVAQMWRAADHGFSPEQSSRVLDLLGTWEMYRKYWPEGGFEDVLRLRLD